MITTNKNGAAAPTTTPSKASHSSKYDTANAPPFGSYCKAWGLALAIGGRTSLAVAGRLVAAARGVLR